MFRRSLAGLPALVSVLLIVLSSNAVCEGESVRISVVALKNFGDAKASNHDQLEFIAERIAEQAVHGVAAVDELQDVDGSAFELLHQAVSRAAKTEIDMKLSKRVGGVARSNTAFSGIRNCWIC